MKNKLNAFALFSFLLLLPHFGFGQNLTQVKVDGGIVQGRQHGDIAIFKGIPFAAPPVGDLRWKAPQPVIPWDGVKVCDEFGPSPMQGTPAPFMFWSSEFLIPKKPISEDCLYLNVWSKAKSSEEKLPVMVYLYGGGFRSGGSGCPIYDGTATAQKGVVFVSINYRVGVFGFFAHPELTKETSHNSSGNYALLDMIAALEWVKKNIQAFGGDPENVTIAGQSAGAFAVNYLMISPLAKGLFHKAIAQSGSSFYADPMAQGTTLADAETQGEEYATRFGCKSIEELRAKSSDQILAAQGLSAPIIDGYVITDKTRTVYEKGQNVKVPLLAGWNKNDVVMAKPLAAAIFKEHMTLRFGEFVNELFSVYPIDTEAKASQSQLDMNRDEAFSNQIYSWVQAVSRQQNGTAYLYNFDRALPAKAPETAYGAFHSGEIVYAYDNLKTVDRPWESADQQVADVMSAYWANFAKSGNPNGPGLPVWEPYSPEKDNTMIIDVESAQKPLPTIDKMRFWEKYYSYMSGK